MIDVRRSCSRYRPVLVDFIDRGELGPETGPALAHLDQCSRCSDAIESTMLTITALRRLGDEATRAEPRADAWPRLQARIAAQPRARNGLVYPMARAVLTIGLAGLLVAPIRLSETPTREVPAEASSVPTANAAAFTTTTATNRLRIPQDPDPGHDARVSGRSSPRVTPDGNAEARKELPSAPSSGPRMGPR